MGKGANPMNDHQARKQELSEAVAKASALGVRLLTIQTRKVSSREYLTMGRVRVEDRVRVVSAASDTPHSAHMAFWHAVAQLAEVGE
jgi:hypothetical protein